MHSLSTRSFVGAFTVTSLSRLLRGFAVSLLVMTAFTRAACQQLLEEETDVRVVKQVPEAGNCGTLPASVTLEFSSEMDASSVSAVNVGTACTANVQISGDDFATCVNFSAAPTSSNGKAFVYTPASAFSAASNYKVKVKTDAKTTGGKALSNEYISAAGFGAQAQLLITEVGMCRYTNRSCWFEIHNKSSQCSVNLADYKVKASYVDSAAGGFPGGTETFDLPDLSLTGGSYLVIRGNATNSGEYINGPGQIYIVKQTLGGADRIPYWTSNGYIEIVKGSTTIDFVRFGTNAQTPTSGGVASWTDGTLPTMWAPNDANYGKSIARNANLVDTNVGDDWVARDFATPGAPNDVTCSTDADNDGIPDCSEVNGSTYAGLNLYAMGARTGQRDVFIEVDYMDSEDPGVIPQKAALDKVKAVFAAKGYKLHFDVGDLYHQSPGINEALHDLGNASAKVPFAQGIELGAAGDKANFYTYKAGHMDIRRRNIFYYMLFAYSRNADGSAGSSGVAEVNGNDSIVALGNWGLVADSNRLINYQASTLMHEWGHNLGLLHGGNDNVNYKPNYYSIMNYHYQLSGLPTLNNNPGDRYYLYRRNNFGDCSLITSVSQLTNNYNSATFLMDFADGAGTAISEGTISEAAGLNRSGSSAIDYNCNGSINGGTISKDLNGDGTTNTLNGFDDWGNINIIFLRKYSGADSGYFQLSGDGEKIRVDPVGNDRQPVVDEPDIAWARK